MDRRDFLALLGGVLLLTGRAGAEDLIGESLNGDWLVSVSGEARERLLRIAGAAMAGGQLSAGDVRYGWLDAKAFAPARDFRGSVSGDTLRIAFYTNANSLIEAELRVGEQTILGTFINAKGRKAEVRLTRLSADEVNALRADATQAGGPRKGGVGRYPAQGRLVAGPGSRIVLGYVGAVNCPACRGYEAEYFGRMEKMKVSLPAFDQIDYITIKLGGFREVVRPQDLPPYLSWVGGDRPGGRPILQNHGTPFFLAAVGEQIWGQGHGVSGLEGIVLPQIRLALAERGMT